MPSSMVDSSVERSNERELQMALQNVGDEESEDEFVSFSEEGEEFHAGPTNGVELPKSDLDEMEEYHIDASEVPNDNVGDLVTRADDDESESGLESESESEALQSGGPLLPPELLKPLPSPAHSLQNGLILSWEQMTRKQRRLRQAHQRKSRKRTYDKIEHNSQGTGVLEAGEAAQAKRGIVPAQTKGHRSVMHGRIAKRRQPKVSQLQRLLESRKKDVASGRKELLRPPTEMKKAKKNKS